MDTPNPYAADLGDHEPIEAMRASVDRMRSLMSPWTPAQFERSYAPGKWTARQLLVHLAQTEIALGNRARMALSTPNYTSQPFDQDRWMEIEGSGLPAEARSAKVGGSGGSSGREALEALVAMNALNRALFASLSPVQRATPFAHPEYGALTVDWLIHQMAGHLRHHLVQLEQIATR
jgi:hypothetical protein